MASLLNEGGFGCVYYPGIKCNGTSSQSTKTITKLQKHDFSSDNELKIGRLITKIKNYKIFFSPATGMCRVNLAKISKKILGKCEVISNKDIDTVVLMDFPYIKNIEFIELLTLNKKHIISELFNIYSVLLEAIELLIENNIVHYDLKLENILFETTTNLPIIIDFGISLYVPHINFKNASEYFYIYSPDYYIWPIEVHVLNYLLNETDITLTELEIKKISNQFVSNNKAINKFSLEFKERYETMCNITMSKYVGMKRENVFEDIISFYNSWDSYSIAITFLNLFSKLIMTNNMITQNETMIKFMESMLLSISPDPKKRPSVRESREKFGKIFYNNESPQEYVNLINVIDINKKTIKKIQDDIKELHSLKLQTKGKSE